MSTSPLSEDLTAFIHKRREASAYEAAHANDPEPLAPEAEMQYRRILRFQRWARELGKAALAKPVPTDAIVHDEEDDKEYEVWRILTEYNYTDFDADSSYYIPTPHTYTGIYNGVLMTPAGRLVYYKLSTSDTVIPMERAFVIDPREAAKTNVLGLMDDRESGTHGIFAIETRLADFALQHGLAGPPPAANPPAEGVQSAGEQAAS